MSAPDPSGPAPPETAPAAATPFPGPAAGGPAGSTVPRLIAARRSIRAFADRPVAPEVLDSLVEAACLAPAPHHSRPWRFALVRRPGAKLALARGMGLRWRHDLEGDGVPADRIDALVDASERLLTGAPALVLGCLTADGLDVYPDAARRRAEEGLALLSLGAAFENLMLAAVDAGLGSCWVAAPMFCPDEARDALDLPGDWSPRALALIGHPNTDHPPRERPPVPLGELRLHL